MPKPFLTEKFITKQELAQTLGVSRSYFQKLLNTLQPQLQEVNYSKTQRLLTPAQIAVIYNYLSNPKHVE